MAIEIQSADVIKVILQFLKENGLSDTASALEAESKISLDYIENRKEFHKSVTCGDWAAVLEETSKLNLSLELKYEIHEQIFYEMLEMNEVEAARAILRQGGPLKQLKESHLDRYLKLENLMSQTVLTGEFPHQLKDSKSNRRERLANMVLNSVQEVPSSRLLTLLSEALRWEEQSGTLSGNCSFDLFHGFVPTSTTIVQSSSAVDKIPDTCFNSVKLPTGSNVESVSISSNGSFFVVGTADGFLEVWNIIEGKLRSDLPYQTNDSNMMTMESAITSTCISDDNDHLACGTSTGQVAVWRLATGKLVKSFPKIHDKGVTHISFSKDGQSLLTCGFDHNIRLLGMKSGRILREYRGHESYVNCALWLPDTRIISGSHDGSLKIWDCLRVECINTIFPNQENSLSPPPIRSISHLITTQTDTLLLITTQSSHLHIFSVQHQKFIKIIPTRVKNSHFLTAVVRKNLIFALLDDGNIFIYKFDDSLAVVEQAKFQVSQVEPIGFALHPILNIFTSFDISGEIKFWNPQ